MAKGIYLDNAQVTSPSDRAIAETLACFTDKWGSASAPHYVGNEAFTAAQKGFSQVYALVGATDDEVVHVTGSGAEAVTQALFSAYGTGAVGIGKNHFIVSAADEAAAILGLGRLEAFGCIAAAANPNVNGQVDAAAIADAMTPRTALVSLSWANGLTGVINPIQEIAALCKDRGVILHVEASHMIGKVFFEKSSLSVPWLSFGSQHIHGPCPCGVLFAEKETPCYPLVNGAEFPTVAFAGLSEAAREARQQLDYMSTEVARLRNRFEEELCEQITDAHVLFRDVERVPHISCMAFPGIVNEALSYLLNRKGVFASIGGGSFQQIALVLQSCKIPAKEAETAMSFSLSRNTTEEEIERAASLIADTVRALRKTSNKLTL